MEHLYFVKRVVYKGQPFDDCAIDTKPVMMEYPTGQILTPEEAKAVKGTIIHVHEFPEIPKHIRGEITDIDEDYEGYGKLVLRGEEHRDVYIQTSALDEMDANYNGAQMMVQKYKDIPYWMELDEELIHLHRKLRRLAKKPPDKF